MPDRPHRSMDQHPLGIRTETKHACPECPIFYANPFCRWCLGTGLVEASRLAFWQRVQDAEAA